MARRMREDLRGEYKATAHGVLLTPVLFIGLFVVAGLIGAGIWLWTASSGARGDASVTRQHNSGQNQVAQNTKLLGDQATITADVHNIGVLAADVKTEQDRMNLQGLELNCASDVAAYNADVRNILAAGYLPAGLLSSYPASMCTPMTVN